MICKRCGSYNSEHLNICRNCGSRLREEPAENLDAGKSTYSYTSIREETIKKEPSNVSKVKKDVETMPVKKERKDRIFIVHGHDDKLKFEVAEWLRSIDLEPVILHLQPNAGMKSVLEKIRSYSNVSAAIVLFTADDNGNAKNERNPHDRARQNVVFEAGYFVGKLGPDNVIILHEPTVELPSDLSGIIFISTASQWKEAVRGEFNLMRLNYLRI